MGPEPTTPPPKLMVGTAVIVMLSVACVEIRAIVIPTIGAHAAAGIRHRVVDGMVAGRKLIRLER